MPFRKVEPPYIDLSVQMWSLSVDQILRVYVDSQDAARRMKQDLEEEGHRVVCVPVYNWEDLVTREALSRARRSG